MNDKRIIYRLLFALSASVLLLFSCSQEDVELYSDDVEDADILFYASLPGVGVDTRSYDNIEEGNLSGGFSVAAMDLDVAIGKKVNLCFENAPVERTPGMGDAFRGDGCKWPEAKGGKEGLLQFFAFYPSIETMKKNAVIDPGDKTDYFLVHHPEGADRSERRDTGYWFNYRMGNYLINKDISTHSDFVSASARGSKINNLYSGVKLEFTHKLCRIDLKALNKSASYDIEVAGVRIGGVIVKSTYNLAGNWISHAANWDCVEYIFNEGDESKKREGDKVITLGASVTSIMGNGGYAMVIPQRPSNLAAGRPGKWSTSNNGGMYFSVLLRVIDKTDNQGLILYPYVDGAVISGTTTADKMKVVYLAVEKATGKVKKRVYRDKTTNLYFTDQALKNPYSFGSDEEIRNYGWAAIPYYAEWYINSHYTYTLDYSNGVGVEDPADVAPGKPIITQFSVGVSADEEIWKMVKDYEEKVIEGFTFEQQ